MVHDLLQAILYLGQFLRRLSASFRKRWLALAKFTIDASGWFISWAMLEASSPRVASRAVWASSSASRFCSSCSMRG